MGFLSKTFKKLKGAVKDIGRLHEKVFNGIFVDPIKKAWKEKPLRYAMIAGAVALGGWALMGAMAPAAAAGGTAIAPGVLGAGLPAGAIGGSSASGLIFPGMSLAGGGATALGGGAATALGGAGAGAATGMTLGQAAALQLGGGLLSSTAQALEGRRQEKMVERERNNATVAGVQYKGGKAEDRLAAGNPFEGVETRPAGFYQPQPQGQSGGMLSQAGLAPIMPSADERLPYYLRGSV